MSADERSIPTGHIADSYHGAIRSIRPLPFPPTLSADTSRSPERSEPAWYDEMGSLLDPGLQFVALCITG